MPSPLVIMLHGDPGSGKDTVAQILVEEVGAKRIGFADEVRRLLEIFDPYVTSEFIRHPDTGVISGTRGVRLSQIFAEGATWDQAKRIYPEVRRIQQVFATEVIRHNVRDNYWARVVQRFVLDHSQADTIVIPDHRFENEARTLDVFDPWTWIIERPDNPHQLTSEQAKHVSEAWHPQLGDRRVVALSNDHTLDSLRESVLTLYTELRDAHEAIYATR